MELLAQIPLVGGLLGWAVPFLVVLTAIVFVHEFGHYIVGRLCGIHAEVFSVGFGKPLLTRTDRRGTRWQVAMIPLGGFVRFVGDMDPASAGKADDDSLTPEQRRVAFHNAGLWRRVLTVAAGPLANFLLSILLFASMAMWMGRESDQPVIGTVAANATEVGLQAGDKVVSVGGQPVETYTDFLKLLVDADGGPLPAVVERGGSRVPVTLKDYQVPRVTQVNPGMPAAGAGMELGDLVVSIDGQQVKSVRELQVLTIDKKPGAEIDVGILRAGAPKEFRFVPAMVEREHPVTGEMALLPTMGINLSSLAEILPMREVVPVPQALEFGAIRTWSIITESLHYIGRMMFDGADRSQLGGPIRIAKMSGDVATQGFSSMVVWIAILSTSIGLINLFPIPILDGGHLMFYAFEGLRGRPVGQTWMRIGTMVGLSLVLLLLVFATYNDLVWLS